MKKAIVAAVSVVGLSGCFATDPRVQTQPVTSFDQDVKVKYVLPRSLIHLKYDETSKTIAATSVPTDIPYTNKDKSQVRYLLGLSPASDLMSTTTLKVEMVPNTRVIASVGTEVKDNIQETAKGVASVAAAVASVVLLTKEPEKELEKGKLKVLSEALSKFNPTAIDVKEVEIDGNTGKLMAVPLNDGWYYQISVLTPIEADFKTYPSSDLKVPSGSILYSYCRDATVALSYGTTPKTVWSASVKVWDPNYVQLIPLPSKGSIKMHPACGYDITDDGVKADVWGDLKAVIEQAVSAKKAFDAKNTGN